MGGAGRSNAVSFEVDRKGAVLIRKESEEQESELMGIKERKSRGI